MNNYIGLTLALSMVACGDSGASSAPEYLNVEMAQLQADTFLKNLFPGMVVNGPVCMPEVVVDQMTQCSYSVQDGAGWKVGTLVCGNTGCRSAGEPLPVRQEMMPSATTSSAGHLDNDWLYWYLLYNNHSVGVYYNSWYVATPPSYRMGYYANHIRPSPVSVNYYHTTYAPSVVQSSQKYSSPSYRAPTARSAGYRSPTTYRSPTGSVGTTPSVSRPAPRPSYSAPRPSAPKPSYSAPRPSPRPSSSRSSGYGVSRSGRR